MNLNWFEGIRTNIMFKLGLGDQTFTKGAKSQSLSNMVSA